MAAAVVMDGPVHTALAAAAVAVQEESVVMAEMEEMEAITLRAARGRVSDLPTAGQALTAVLALLAVPVATAKLSSPTHP
jgi:hypothetical protein